MLRQLLAARQQADAELSAAVRLVLATVGAPEDAQVVVSADGSMCVRTSDNNALSDESEPPIREG